MENKKEEYTLSNEDLKFPTFYDKSLNEIFKKEKMTKEILFEDISNTINLLNSIIDWLINMIKNNINNFDNICLKYNLNIYDYIVIMKLIISLILAIEQKIKKEEIKIKIYSLDDFFKNEEIKDILDSQHKIADKNYEDIKNKISQYNDDIKDIIETEHECGINFMCYIFKYYITILKKVKNKMDIFCKLNLVLEKDDSKAYHKNMIVFFDLIYILRILEKSNLMLHNSYFVDKNDFYNLEEDSDEWNNIKKIMYRVNTKNKDKIEEINVKGQKDFEKMTVFFNKAINLDSYLVTNIAKLAGYALKFKMNSDENLMEFESKESTLISNKLFIFDFIKLGDIKLFKIIREKSFPKIELREKIYMKKKYPEISLEYIKQLLIKIYDEEIITKNFGNTKQKDRIILDENKKKHFPLWAQKLKKEDKPYYVSTRLLNSYKFNNFGMKKKQSSFFGLFETKIENVKAEKTKAIILYLHGGGFLRFKNFFHEYYLRDLCNRLKIPLLGIDYASAPEHPYPEGLNDCFQMYMWILDHCEKELGFKPEKIILAGDSSGGNFVLALTFLILSINEYEDKKIRVPDFLLPLYPCCHTGIKNMTLTLATSFEDLMLDIKALHYINRAYRGYYPNDLDPFINPLEISDNILKKMPPTRFMTATYDPLRDDTIRLIRRISKIPGLDVKNYEFTNYQHGFMGNENNMISGPPKEIFCKEIEEFLNK